ncbi:hypothetical protein Emag_005115 [Eimeria magna]
MRSAYVKSVNQRSYRKHFEIAAAAIAACHAAAAAAAPAASIANAIVHAAAAAAALTYAAVAAAAAAAAVSIAAAAAAALLRVDSEAAYLGDWDLGWNDLSRAYRVAFKKGLHLQAPTAFCVGCTMHATAANQVYVHLRESATAHHPQLAAANRTAKAVNFPFNGLSSKCCSSSKSSSRSGCSSSSRSSSKCSSSKVNSSSSSSSSNRSSMNNTFESPAADYQQQHTMAWPSPEENRGPPSLLARECLGPLPLSGHGCLALWVGLLLTAAAAAAAAAAGG